jgi:hypothetical protein
MKVICETCNKDLDSMNCTHLSGNGDDFYLCDDCLNPGVAKITEPEDFEAIDCTLTEEPELEFEDAQ